jgi:hypothetical protein
MLIGQLFWTDHEAQTAEIILAYHPTVQLQKIADLRERVSNRIIGALHSDVDQTSESSTWETCKARLYHQLQLHQKTV